MEDDNMKLLTFPVKVNEDGVFLDLPPTSELDQVIFRCVWVLRRFHRLATSSREVFHDAQRRTTYSEAAVRSFFHAPKADRQRHEKYRLEHEMTCGFACVVVPRWPCSCLAIEPYQGDVSSLHFSFDFSFLGISTDLYGRYSRAELVWIRIWLLRA